MDIKKDTRTHTALHVLKGAVYKVLGAKWTASVYQSGTHGRLTVQFNRKPTTKEISEIEKLANQKIAEGVPVKEFEMDKEDAEARWGDIIYDLFPLPPGIKKIKILYIEDWNINACKEEHVKNTREIGMIKIKKVKFRPSRNLLEISFDIIEK